MTEEDLDRRSDWESSYAVEHKVLPWHEALYVAWRLTAWQLRQAPAFAEQLTVAGGAHEPAVAQPVVAQPVAAQPVVAQSADAQAAGAQAGGAEGAGTERVDAVVGLLAVRIWEAAYRADLLRVADAALSAVGAVPPEDIDELLAGPAPVESDAAMWTRLAEGHQSGDWAPIRLAVGEVLNAHLHAAEEVGNLDPTVQARLPECPAPNTDEVSALVSAADRAAETARLTAAAATDRDPA